MRTFISFVNTVCGKNCLLLKFVPAFIVAFAKLQIATVQIATVIFVMTVCLSLHRPVWKISASTGHIFIQFDSWRFLENLSRKFVVHYILTRTTGTLREDLSTIVIISLSFLRRRRNISDKSCRDNQNTHFILHNFFPKILPFFR
jgi:hypothetical protein